MCRKSRGGLRYRRKVAGEGSPALSESGRDSVGLAGCTHYAGLGGEAAAQPCMQPVSCCRPCMLFYGAALIHGFGEEFPYFGRQP